MFSTDAYEVHKEVMPAAPYAAIAKKARGTNAGISGRFLRVALA